MTRDTVPIKCPICDKMVPCVSNLATIYCLALHIAAKWDDEPHVRWREEHGIVTKVYQSLGQVQTMARQIMKALPQSPNA
jgi:hypothetical protein